MLVDLAAAPQRLGVALAQDPVPPPGKGEEFGKASPLGLVVVVLLLIATLFLIRSMTKHLRKVPASFDDPGQQPPVGDAQQEGRAAGQRSFDRGAAGRSAVNGRAVDPGPVDPGPVDPGPVDPGPVVPRLPDRDAEPDR